MKYIIIYSQNDETPYRVKEVDKDFTDEFIESFNDKLLKTNVVNNELRYYNQNEHSDVGDTFSNNIVAAYFLDYSRISSCKKSTLYLTYNENQIWEASFDVRRLNYRETDNIIAKAGIKSIENKKAEALKPDRFEIERYLHRAVSDYKYSGENSYYKAVVFDLPKYLVGWETDPQIYYQLRAQYGEEEANEARADSSYDKPNSQDVRELKEKIQNVLPSKYKAVITYGEKNILELYVMLK